MAETIGINVREYIRECESTARVETKAPGLARVGRLVWSGTADEMSRRRTGDGKAPDELRRGI